MRFHKDTNNDGTWLICDPHWITYGVRHGSSATRDAATCWETEDALAALAARAETMAGFSSQPCWIQAQFYSYGKWLEIVSLSIKNGDLPQCHVSLPEVNWYDVWGYCRKGEKCC